MVSIALLQLIEDEDEENFMFLLYASARNKLDADSDYENN